MHASKASMHTVSKGLKISPNVFDKGRLRGFASVAVAVCVVLSALVTLVAMVPSADAAEDPYYQYRVGTMAGVDTFNPFSMTSGTSWSVAHMMYEFLYAVGPQMNETPQLAVSHEMSTDGKVWTYYLAEDSYFHDGVQVTAHDVAFTFNMIMNGGKQTALYKGYIEGIVSVVATGDFTVQITLEEPKATMLGLIVPILPEHIWSDIEADGVIKTVEYFEDTEYFPDGPVGSGPLVLDEYSRTGDFIRLLAHEQYHQHEGLDTDRINVDEVLLVIYENEQLMTADLQTGEIDAIDGVPPMVWETVLGYGDVVGQTPTAHILEEFGFNCASQEWRESLNDQDERNFPDASTNYETCNLSVRRAMTMATDVPFIAEEIHQGLAVAADSLTPIATPFWHYDVPEEEYYHFDIEAANELLNESGYHQFDGSDFGFAGVRENESSGARLEFEFYVIRSIDIDELTALQMQIWWEQIGVKVNIIQVSEGVLYGIWFNMAYDLFIWSWWPDVDPTFLLSVLTTDEIPTSHTDTTAWSDAFYSNPDYDQMYLDQQKLMDKYERQAMVFDMQRIAYRDCPYICLVYPASLIAYRTDTYENFPDMELNAGVSPSSFWYYFEITPIGGVTPVNEPPYDVDAGDDVAIYVGDSQTFSGSAEDLESPTEDLSWTWVIDENGVETTLDGQAVSYTFDIVGTFDVTLTVEDPDGASTSDSLTVTVEEIPEGGLGWIVGYVEDAAGDPVVGALVTVVGADKHENVDELGMYNITVEPGTYDLVASADGYSNDTASVSVEVDVGSWANFTLGMTSGSVTGQVLDSVTEDPVVDALVKLFEPGEEIASYSKKTDDDGSFEIPLVDEGTYEVVVSRTGYETNDTESITVTVGETTTLVIYLTADDEKNGGLSTTAVVAIAALAIIAAVAAVALLLKRKKGSEPDLPEDESPPDQTTEPPEPPEA